MHCPAAALCQSSSIIGTGGRLNTSSDTCCPTLLSAAMRCRPPATAAAAAPFAAAAAAPLLSRGTACSSSRTTSGLTCGRQQHNKQIQTVLRTDGVTQPLLVAGLVQQIHVLYIRRMPQQYTRMHPSCHTHYDTLFPSNAAQHAATTRRLTPHAQSCNMLFHNQQNIALSHSKQLLRGSPGGGAAWLSAAAGRPCQQR